MTSAAALLPVEAAAPAVTYRLAGIDDGPAIGALFKAAAYGDLGADWSRANPANGWLLAEQGGVLVGAIQIACGQPYGFIGDCVVRPSARARHGGAGRFGSPGRVTMELYFTALAILRQMGSQMALGVTAKPGLKRILKRYGAVSLGQAELFGKGLIG